MPERQTLDSWKEIADYLKRSEKTCRRLERELGLPVHRLEDTPKARVFAYKDEIDRWLEKTQHSEKKIFFGKSRFVKLLIPALVIVTLAVIAVGIWQFLLRKTAVNPLSPRLSVAVISFENQTGDNSYDYLKKVVPNLLITSLEQSGYFYVTSWERLHDLLKQMGKEDLEVIDIDLGFEICQIDDIDAIVLGSFTKAGDVFVTDVKVLDVETKRILKSVSSRGKGEKSLIQSQIDELSKEISRGIGIPERKIEANPRRIADVTTDSLDAYYYYVRGKECLKYGNVEDGGKFLKKAIELDPNFAMAYLLLGSTYSVASPDGRKALHENFKKAKKLSARATEKESLFIEETYARFIEKDLEKSFRIASKMVKLYPKEKSSYYKLGATYLSRGLFKQALNAFNRALELDPSYVSVLFHMASTYGRLGNYEKQIEYIEKYRSVSPEDAGTLEYMAVAYFKWGKLDEALAKFKEALEVDPDYEVHWLISYFFAFKEEYSEAMSWIDRYIDGSLPGSKGMGNFLKCFYHYWLGGLDQSMRNLHRLISYADTVKFNQWKANAFWMMGWISLDRGEFEFSRKHFKNWFDIYMQDVLPEKPNSAAIIPHETALYYFHLGLVDLKQGRIDLAKSRLVEINSLLSDVLPEYKKWIKFYYNFLQAEILLVEGAVEKAITVCEKSSPLGASVGGSLILHNVPFLKDVLARAYLQNGETDKAIAEYERLIVFDPQREERYLIHPKYYYRLAELYEQKGQKKKAIEHYEKFLSLWKDADPGMAEVEDAKKRLAGLKSD